MGNIARSIYFTTFRGRCQERRVRFEDGIIKKTGVESFIAVEIGEGSNTVDADEESIFERSFEVGFRIGERVEDGRFEAREVFCDGKEVRESVADVEGTGEVEFDGEVEHFLEEVDLSGAVVGFIMIVKADFADSNQFFGALAVDMIFLTFLRVDTVGPEDVFMRFGEAPSIIGVLRRGADTDDLTNVMLASVLEEGGLLVF